MCTQYLLACQVKVIVGFPGFCCCDPRYTRDVCQAILIPFVDASLNTQLPLVTQPNCLIIIYNAVFPCSRPVKPIFFFFLNTVNTSRVFVRWGEVGGENRRTKSGYFSKQQRHRVTFSFLIRSAWAQVKGGGAGGVSQLVGVLSPVNR